MPTPVVGALQCVSPVWKSKPAGCTPGCEVPGGAVTHAPKWRERGITLLCVCTTQSENSNQEEKKKGKKKGKQCFEVPGQH